MLDSKQLSLRWKKEKKNAVALLTPQVPKAGHLATPGWGEHSQMSWLVGWPPVQLEQGGFCPRMKDGGGVLEICSSLWLSCCSSLWHCGLPVRSQTRRPLVRPASLQRLHLLSPLLQVVYMLPPRRAFPSRPHQPQPCPVLPGLPVFSPAHSKPSLSQLLK